MGGNTQNEATATTVLEPGMKIGEVARLSGLSVKTIRFYCEQGLIQPSTHTEGGYRLFSAPVIMELNLIRALKSVETPLSQIKKVMDVRRAGLCNCMTLKNTLNTKIIAINQKIFELQHMQNELESLLRSWQECGGLKIMDQP